MCMGLTGGSRVAAQCELLSQLAGSAGRRYAKKIERNLTRIVVVVAVLVMIWRNRADAIRRKMKSACPENCRQKDAIYSHFLS